MPGFASTTPVTPPTVNRKMKPMAQSSGVRNSTEPPHIVAIHEKTLTPVGTAITMLETAKKACVSSDMPTVYIWCAQTAVPEGRGVELAGLAVENMSPPGPTPMRCEGPRITSAPCPTSPLPRTCAPAGRPFAPPHRVVNLMEALRRSVAEDTKGAAARKGASATPARKRA